MISESSAGTEIAAGAGTIEVHVVELRQLFNAMDPAPFHHRDLDPGAERFILESARELPRDARLALRVHIDRPVDVADEAVLRESVHRYFTASGKAARQQLRLTLRRGRLSLLIGLAFLCASLGASQLLEQWLHPGGMIGVLKESLLIGGWVAMWRPLEIFLYDWWPILAEARLFDRLAAMPVGLRSGS